jgi:hypothetical protein
VYEHLRVLPHDTNAHCAVDVLQDFAEVAAAHEAFLRTVMAQTLLGRTMVTQMHHVFALARQLCALVKGARDRTRGVDLAAVMVRRGFRVWLVLGGWLCCCARLRAQPGRFLVRQALVCTVPRLADEFHMMLLMYRSKSATAGGS